MGDLRVSIGGFFSLVGLIVLGAEFLILQTNQDLAFFHFVALFHPNPGDTARDLGVYVDLVVSDDVSAGGKHDTAGIAAFGSGTGGLNLGHIR